VQILQNQPELNEQEIMLAEDLPSWAYSAEELRVMNEEAVRWDAEGRWVPVYSAAIERMLVLMVPECAVQRHQELDS